MPADKASYYARDFDTLVDDLLAKIKAEYGAVYNDFSTSAQGMMLVDLFSFAADQLGWYVDRRAAESFLVLAQQRSSVARLSRQLGYAMQPAVSSSTDLMVAPAQARVTPWELPSGFAFQGPDGLVFESLQSVSWAASDAAVKSVAVREGRSRVVTAAGTGEPNQMVRLTAAGQAGKYLLQGSVRVTVDGADWQEVEFLAFDASDVYEVHYLDEPPMIRFGSGVAGNVPPPGAEIRVRFVVASGRMGNVARNTIKAPVSPLVVSFEPVTLAVSQPSAATGGDDPESIESAKVNAPRYFASRGVAVTRDDYRALALAFFDPQYGKAASATAFVARSADTDVVSSDIISSISAMVLDYQESVTLVATELDADLASSVASLAQIPVLLTQISGALDTVAAQSVSIINGTTRVRADVSLFNGISQVLNNLKSGLEDLNASAAGRLTLDESQSLSEILLVLEQMADISGTMLSQVFSSIDAVASAGRLAVAAASDVLTVPSEIAAAATASVNAIDAALTALPQLPLIIDEHRVLISNRFADLSIYLDSVLSADCKANVITVPILARDADGFYAAPSRGLTMRLRTYLEERADVAHSVQVVSGASSLVQAFITMEIKPAPRYTYAEVASEAQARVKERQIANRRFGVSLFLHELHAVVRDTPGVELANVKITGDAGFLDGFGNLIIPASKVITMGAISTTELE